MFNPLDIAQPLPCNPTNCDDTATQKQYPPPPPPPPECTPPEGCLNWDSTTCQCLESSPDAYDPWTPIILAVGQSSDYQLVGPRDGVWFDLNADGTPDRLGWTRANDPVGFLVLDRNHNGIIDHGRELFGNYTPLEGDQTAAHGFEALAYWDRLEAGGNGDGWIDAADAVWPNLQVWIDANHDGFSQPTELFPLSTFEITRVSTYAFAEMRRDQFGNLFRLRGAFIIGAAHRWAYDVYLVVAR